MPHGIYLSQIQGKNKHYIETMDLIDLKEGME